jgi:hypothetical protein
MDVVLVVRDNFETFHKREGSGEIASRGSQLNLLELLREHAPKRVLDWGTGLGTLVPIYRQAGVKSIVAFERNVWCREQFAKNIRTLDDVILVDQLPNDTSFDFVTFDDEVESKNLRKIIGRQTFPEIIFVEGWRNRTIVRISFLILRRGLKARFVRLKDRSIDFGLNEREKSGSYFQLHGASRFESLSSWLQRRNATFETREIRNFVLRKTKLFEFMAWLNVGGRVRKLFRIQSKSKERYWKRVY